MTTNLSRLAEDEFKLIANEIDGHAGHSEAIAWAASKPATEVHPQIVAEVITQDEYTHDVIVPYKDVFLVYDTT